jgi:hypothetical protein
MITKAASNNGVTKQEAGWLNIVDACLAEMGIIRRRMKSTDQRIRRADAAISRSVNETRAILRHVQASR